MLLYVADTLAGAFVVPHPDDYRALHPTLLQDFYGELIYHYAHLYPAVPNFRARIDETRVDSVEDLRTQILERHQEWDAVHRLMAGGLLDAEFATQPVYRMGCYTLSRFLPAFDPGGENHLGETITDTDGRLAYLKTFRLSAAQIRRGHLLSRLAAHDWDLAATAVALGTDREGLVLRLDRAGFGHLVRADIIDACRNRARQARDHGIGAQ